VEADMITAFTKAGIKAQAMVMREKAREEVIRLSPVLENIDFKNQ
jgi:hypothetical protein